jgi:hypothetical protein
MYTKLFPEMMSKYSTVEAIVRGVWDLIGSGNLSGVAYDAVRHVQSTFTLKLTPAVCISIASIHFEYYSLGSLQTALRFTRYYLWTGAGRRGSERGASRCDFSLDA